MPNLEDMQMFTYLMSVFMLSNGCANILNLLWLSNPFRRDSGDLIELPSLSFSDGFLFLTELSGLFSKKGKTRQLNVKYSDLSDVYHFHFDHCNCSF